MKAILLLGGNGLIGSKLKETFKSNYNIDIFNIDKKDVDLSLFSNRDLIKERINKIKPEATIVLASIKRQHGDNYAIKKHNDAITENVSMCLSEKESKVIYISSCAVYGEKNNQIEFNESSILSPTSSYGEHKLKSENTYKKFIDKKRLLIIRPPLIYDMDEINGYHPGGFLHSAIKNKIIKLWGSGNEKREFILLRDAVNIIIKLTLLDARGIYNIASGESYSYRDIAEYIKKKFNCKIFERERTGIPVDHSYNNEKLMKLIKKYNFTDPYQAVDNYIN
tara:strand:- start:7041 stop:7880 length:840 start_codon:yes stop_codon:yes gene_type:complete